MAGKTSRMRTDCRRPRRDRPPGGMLVNANHFDALARNLAARLPRRLALRQGAAALITGIGFATARHTVVAQDTSPANEDGIAGSDLFVQTFASGTLTPKAGEDGGYTLSLEGSL